MNKSSISVAVVIVLLLGGLSNIIPFETQNARAEEPPSTVVIIEVYYDTYLSFEPEECIRLFNPTPFQVNISGWQLTDQEGIIEFPLGTEMSSNGSLYITGDASAFFEESLIMADFEYDVDSEPSVPQMIVVSGTLTMANGGDEVILFDDSSNTVDVVAYDGSGYGGAGWSGAPAAGVSEGSILKRYINETSGYYIDTNTSADWDYIRQYKVGQSNFSYKTFTFTGNVTAFASPDSSFENLVEELDSAQTSIFLNMYQFTNPHLALRLVNASNRGVDVKVFLEGGPVGGIIDKQKYISRMLYENGTEVRFMITDDPADIHDRYTYTHAKYCIIDNESVIVMSENWKPTGVPTDSSFGNRGWGIAVRNSSVAHYLADVFFEDWNPIRKDSFPYTPGHAKYGEPPAGFVMDYSIPEGLYPSPFDSATIDGTFTISPVLAPETSLLTKKSVIAMIDKATESVLIEQLACDPNWTWYGDYYDNWYLEAAIDAARKGCRVRILLDSLYNWSDPDNYETTLYVNSIAEAEGLDMEAKLAFLGGYEKIHNKGVIVDGTRTLVSSINWGYNSVNNNREVGLIVENSDVADYYSQIFWYDWDLTELHLTMNPGWNLISIPLIQEEQDLNTVLKSIEGDYNAVQYYDIVDTSDQWKHYRVGKPWGNDLSKVNIDMGLWVHVNSSTDVILTYFGASPIQNQTITLHPGWNHVGYPSMTNRTRAEALNNLTFDLEVDAVFTFDAKTQSWDEIGPSDSFEVGRGYWIHATQEWEWEVPL